MGKGKGEIVGSSVEKPGGRPVGSSVGIGWSVGGPAEGTPNEGKSADGKLTEGSPVGKPIDG